MAKSEALGIQRLDNVVFYVHDLARSHQFYCDKVDFAWVAESSEAEETRSGERARVYEAGDVRMTVVQPLNPASVSGRYLRRHPDGVATLVFEVADVEATFRTLDERGATLVTDIVRAEDAGGTLAWFDIATPFGEANFRFQERRGYRDPAPGLTRFETPKGGTNRFAFDGYDHITSNFLTLKPMELWCREVLGLERYWEVAFHTDDVARVESHGSGLKSIVLWDPHSGIKFANNEPMRPHFEQSQIYVFVMDNHGEGIQHAAITTRDIQTTVRGLRERGVVFMPTPGSYYDALPERLVRCGIGRIEEDIETLRELEILVDGKHPQNYLLQIFLKEAAGLYADQKAGPFFFEIIERKGDKGFGEGNFRALFESIERTQKAEGAAR